jgi:hypothetical protein
MNFYRGIKYNPEDIKTEKVTSKPGIYRGFKHDPIKVKSKPMPYGVYRGVKWTA